MATAKYEINKNIANQIKNEGYEKEVKVNLINQHTETWRYERKAWYPKLVRGYGT